MTESNGKLRVQKLLNQFSEQKDAGLFSGVATLPPDAIFLTKKKYLADTDAKKVNLGIGAYRDKDGKPQVLDVVKTAEKQLLELTQSGKQNKEYLGITGDLDYVRLTQQLILGKDCQRLSNGLVAGAQALSGTGSLRVLFDFMKGTVGKNANFKVLLSQPTWGNHQKIIGKAGLRFEYYTYWDASKRALALDTMLNDLRIKGNKGDVVLLHACAHNPTGVDPTEQEWAQIADVMKEKGLVPFFDSAYQGFASGDLAKDAFAVRFFEQRGFDFFIAQSYSKNLGLYCERAGCASIVTSSAEQAKACQTQLAAIIRPMYSNPPAHGARIVKQVLGGDGGLFDAWNKEMGGMSGRIIEMRKALRDELISLKTPGTWDHITSQIGMFSYTGLTPTQCDYITSTYHIYLLRNGRISMAGVAPGNVKYIAEAINAAVLNSK